MSRMKFCFILAQYRNSEHQSDFKPEREVTPPTQSGQGLGCTVEEQGVSTFQRLKACLRKSEVWLHGLQC
jgi:hypothetical protein